MRDQEGALYTFSKTSRLDPLALMCRLLYWQVGSSSSLRRASSHPICSALKDSFHQLCHNSDRFPELLITSEACIFFPYFLRGLEKNHETSQMSWTVDTPKFKPQSLKEWLPRQVGHCNLADMELTHRVQIRRSFRTY